jgi:putative transposase
MQAWKQSVARHLNPGAPFWQTRYYDFNVYTGRKRMDKLRYIHHNPVRRGLVESPGQWPWSSFRQYAFGLEGPVTVSLPWQAEPIALAPGTTHIEETTKPGAPF